MVKVVIKIGFINVLEIFLNFGCCKYLVEVLKVCCIVIVDIYISYSMEVLRILLLLVLVVMGVLMRKM